MKKTSSFKSLASIAAFCRDLSTKHPRLYSEVPLSSEAIETPGGTYTVEYRYSVTRCVFTIHVLSGPTASGLLPDGELRVGRAEEPLTLNEARDIAAAWIMSRNDAADGDQQLVAGCR